MKETNLDDCCRRLDLIAKLLIRKFLNEDDSVEDDLVVDLTNMGFTAKESAALLGKTPNAVEIKKTRLRKKGILKGAKNG